MTFTQVMGLILWLNRESLLTEMTYYCHLQFGEIQNQNAHTHTGFSGGRAVKRVV